VPFAAPFADPLLYENPSVLAIVEALLGDDSMLLLFGGDTPALGSETQGFHADLPELHPEVVMPTFCLTVNIPLVDVTAENGPFEGAPGTHRLSNAEGMRRIERGEAPLTPYLVRRGDVMIRDPRMLHRGTPNRTAEPRPVLVIAYHRPWYRHYGHEAMAICPALRDTLSPRGRSLLRLHLDRRFA
jgi:ectoine hydroxylase-related dioxygenase (phytanoyl-CoA dioxygenase family)